MSLYLSLFLSLFRMSDLPSMHALFSIHLHVSPYNPPIHPLLSSPRFAYVDFATPEEMETALTLSEQPLDGRSVLIKAASNFETTGKPRGFRGSDRKLRVSVAGEGESRGEGQGQGYGQGEGQGQGMRRYTYQHQQQPGNAKLFLGNLPFETEREDCVALLAPFGAVTELRLGQFEDSGKCKG